MTKVLDIDLADGCFYAGGFAHEAYRWMREHQPIFRDRNGLAAAATYQAVIDAERNPACSPIAAESGPTLRQCLT